MKFYDDREEYFECLDENCGIVVKVIDCDKSISCDSKYITMPIIDPKNDLKGDCVFSFCSFSDQNEKIIYNVSEKEWYI